MNTLSAGILDSLRHWVVKCEKFRMMKYREVLVHLLAEGEQLAMSSPHETTPKTFRDFESKVRAYLREVVSEHRILDRSKSENA